MDLLKTREVLLSAFTPHLRQYGLSLQQWRVMRVLIEYPHINQSKLCEISRLQFSSSSRIVKNLCDKKILNRTKDKTDLRQSLLQLTAKGIALTQEIIPLSEEIYESITDKFGYDKLELLYELLEELRFKVR